MIRRALLLLLLAGCAHQPPRARPACGGSMLDAAASPLVFTEVADTGLPARGQWRDGFDVADMDGDAHLDVVHGAARKGPLTPSIFLGDGQGHFQTWKDAHFPPLPYDYGDVAAGDVNRDGVMDLALSSHLRGLAVLIGEGHGHYAPWGEGLELRAPGQFPDGASFSSRAIALTDWNGDGALDLLALNEGPSRFATAAMASDALAVYLNRNGSWQRVAGEVRLSSFGSDLAIGDVDGDGHPDALAGSLVTGARRLLHTSRGATWTSRDVPGISPRAITTAVALADVAPGRGDELLVATLTSEPMKTCAALELLRDGATTLLWSAPQRLSVSRIAAADLDGDRDRDLVALRDDGTLLVFTNARGHLQRDAVVALPERFRGCNGFDLHLADLDGDGRPEAIASYAGDASMTVGRQTCASGGGFAVWSVAR